MKWQVFNNIYFTKGHNRTLIYDSLSSDINFIPNELFKILLAKGFTITEDDIDKEYFDYLIENKYLHEVHGSIENNFSMLSTIVEIPYYFAILVIELSLDTATNLYKLINTDDYWCNFGQLNFVFSDYTSLDSFDLFISFIERYEVDVIELTFLDGFKFTDDLFKKMKSIKRIIIVNNFSSKLIEDNYSKYSRMYSNVNIESLKISPDLTTYLDSDSKHIYFYNKLFIGHKSDIKNSSVTENIYGYLNKLDSFNVHDILQWSQLKKYWDITKDKILVCSSCEFRRLCNDNRLPKSIEGTGKYFHDKECEYNPFISKWNSEDGYKGLSECGIQLSNGKLIMDEEKLDEINTHLWGS